jgi:hypothetical protein
LKDKPYLDVSNTQPVIEFGQSLANGITNQADAGYIGAFYFEGDTAAAPVPTYDTAIALILASPQVLNDSIAVTIALDPTQIAPWNAAEGDTLTMIPDSLFSMPMMTIGISPQHRIGNIPVTIPLSKFPTSNAYGLPIKIVNAVDVTNSNNLIVVSSNSGKFMWIFER